MNIDPLGNSIWWNKIFAASNFHLSLDEIEFPELLEWKVKFGDLTTIMRFFLQVSDVSPQYIFTEQSDI